jgi:hypothetical protein
MAEKPISEEKLSGDELAQKAFLLSMAAVGAFIAAVFIFIL